MHRSEIFLLSSVIVLAAVTEFYHAYAMQMTRSQKAHNVIHPAITVDEQAEQGRTGHLGYLRDVQSWDNCRWLGVCPRSSTLQRGRNMCNGARIALNNLQIPGMPECTGAECVPRKNFRIGRRTLAKWSWSCEFYCNEVPGRATVQFNNAPRSFYWISEIQVPNE